MKNTHVALALLLIITLNRCKCTKEFECFDYKIQTAFIGFQLSEIDTFVVRKYKAADNFQNLIDTLIVVRSDAYRVSNDTTKVIYYQEGAGIVTGFDWQLFIPSLNTTVFISDIVSNKKTTECGFRATDCACANDLISAKQNGQTISFQQLEPPFIFIRK